MQGDFSRVTFDPQRHYSAVLGQQGRVQLDADGNEQAAIQLYQLRTLATDLIGPAGYPRDPDQGMAGEWGGFGIPSVSDEDFTIAPGRMYVDGILVENDRETTYWTQPDGHLVPEHERDRLPTGRRRYLIYLRVWEQLITAVQDPAIREIALGDHGPDTAARSRVVWQVAAYPEPVGDADGFPNDLTPMQWLSWLRVALNRGTEVVPRLAAWARRPDEADHDVCDIDPESRYRGPENQLYRVEIHRGGSADEATFKWSRENASVVLPIASIAGGLVTLVDTGRDGKLGLEVGDMVEVVDDAYAARVADDTPAPMAEPEPFPRLYRVERVDHAARTVTLDGNPGSECGGVGSSPGLHPFLRRWDHRPARSRSGTAIGGAADGAIPIEPDGREFELEDGLMIGFVPPDEEKSQARYRRGDSWLIPARVVTGDVEWPTENGAPVARRPHGVEYHYAPLALVDGSGRDVPDDLRLPFPWLTAFGQRQPVPGGGQIRPVPTEEVVSRPPLAPPAGAAPAATMAAAKREATAKRETAAKREAAESTAAKATAKKTAKKATKKTAKKTAKKTTPPSSPEGPE